MEPEAQKDQKNQEKKPENKGIGNYARYTGIGAQMIVIILLTVWGGKKLDQHFLLEKPVFTIILSLLGVFTAIYTAIKEFLK